MEEEGFIAAVPSAGARDSGGTYGSAPLTSASATKPSRKASVGSTCSRVEPFAGFKMEFNN